MKKIIFLTLIIMVVVLSGCATPDQSDNPASALTQTQAKQYELSELEHAYIKVDNMGCAGCAIGIEYNLKSLAGVTDAAINFQDGEGEIIYNPNLVSASDIKTAANPYTVNLLKTVPATAYYLN